LAIHWETNNFAHELTLHHNPKDHFKQVHCVIFLSDSQYLAYRDSRSTLRIADTLAVALQPIGKPRRSWGNLRLVRGGVYLQHSLRLVDYSRLTPKTTLFDYGILGRLLLKVFEPKNYFNVL
jgi:hypothetical protein